MSADRYSRQSFLGPGSEARIARCTVGVAGLGGGGSHIVQQLAHIGFKRYVDLHVDGLARHGGEQDDVAAAGGGTRFLHLPCGGTILRYGIHIASSAVSPAVC